MTLIICCSHHHPPPTRCLNWRLLQLENLHTIIGFFYFPCSCYEFCLMFTTSETLLKVYTIKCCKSSIISSDCTTLLGLNSPAQSTHLITACQGTGLNTNWDWSSAWPSSAPKPVRDDTDDTRLARLMIANTFPPSFIKLRHFNLILCKLLEFPGDTH